MPLTFFINQPQDWRNYAQPQNNEMVERLMEAFWPGLLNRMLKKKKPVSDTMVSDTMVCGGA